MTGPKSDYKNWSCCHIWSADDPTFQLSNHVVQDHRFFSYVGNVVPLPTPLKAFTNAIPEIKVMLQLCVKNLYGWSCGQNMLPHEHAAVDGFAAWDDYPESWPRTYGQKTPLGMIPMHLNPSIYWSAKKRLERIWLDLAKAGQFYPRAKVQDAMS